MLQRSFGGAPSSCMWPPRQATDEATDEATIEATIEAMSR
jgi:hypothetical protein